MLLGNLEEQRHLLRGPRLRRQFHLRVLLVLIQPMPLGLRAVRGRVLPLRDREVLWWAVEGGGELLR